jgi:iron complex transport system permease protein
VLNSRVDSMNKRWSVKRWGGLLVLLLLASALINLSQGAAELTVAELWQAIWLDGDPVTVNVVWDLRLPRMLVGALVGIHFSLAGGILQAVLRNPLADANLLGISGGASLMSVLVFVLADVWLTETLQLQGIYEPTGWLTLLSITGGVAAALLVYRLSWAQGVAPSRLILSGIAIATILEALVTGVLAGWGQANAETILIWLAGSLYGRDWLHVQVLLPWTVLGILLVPCLFVRLNLLQLGDEVAKSLGLKVELWRFLALALAACLAASAVGMVGPIGFVGLIVPHITRRLVGSELKSILILSPLVGAVLVILADVLARTLLQPYELPVGVVTSLIGVPFFIYLLRRTYS